jgi:hypothetical protein
MDVRRRRQVRAAVCLGLPALAIALCSMLGIGASAAAHAASSDHSHSAMVPAPHRALPAFVRMQDPIGFDIVTAGHPTTTPHTADSAAPSVSHHRVSVEPDSAHSRGPPAWEHV